MRSSVASDNLFHPEYAISSNSLSLAPSNMLATGFVATNNLGWELLTAVLILLVGLAVYLPFRRLVQRAQLLSAYMVFTLASAAYLAIAIVEPLRSQQGLDPMTWWLHRAVLGAMLFVAVRLVDRLIIVPTFSRGGTTQVPRFIHQLILIVLSVFVFLMYGKTAFGWPINDFLTGGAVVSIVIGLALQESLGNLFSGLVLQAAPPFVLGDFILAGSLEGRVVDMTWRAVTLQTNDDNYVVIPNGTIAKQEIVNYNAPSSATARLVKVSLECDLPPCDAVEVLQRAARETTGVQATPPPVAIMLDYGESAILYGIKFWILEPRQHLKIEHAVRLNLWYRLKEKGYEIPSPIRRVEHLRLENKLRLQRDADAVHRQQVLAKLPLLAPLSTEQHQQLAEGASSVMLAPGQILFTQDDPGESFYIVHRGKAEILVQGSNGTTSIVASLGAGEFFGEMSALTGQPRTATVRAGSALSLVEICKGDLQRIVDSDPSILEKMSELIARRNVEREAHVKGIELQGNNADAVKMQQQSLLGRMAAFFRKKGA